MPERHKTVRQLTHEFFLYYPDYQFCRTLAINIENNVTTYENAVDILAKKSWASPLKSTSTASGATGTSPNPSKRK